MKKLMMKKLAMLLAGTMLTGALFGCGSDGGSSPSAAGSGAGSDAVESNTASGTLKYALFLASVPNETTMSIRDEAIAAAEEKGIELSVFLGNDNQSEQIGQIETCIIQGYNGLIIEPISSDGCNEAMKTAKDNGVAVVTVMQDCSDPSLVYSHIGADHEGAAALQMQNVCDALGGSGKIAIIDGVMGSTGQLQLTSGYNSVLEKYPDIQVVEEQSADWLIDGAIEITETWLQKYSDLDAIVAQSDQMALGALQACTDMGVNLCITGRDAQTPALEAVKAGTMYGTVSQSAGQMGRIAVETLTKVLQGETVENVYYTSNVFVNKDNVDEYLAG